MYKNLIFSIITFLFCSCSEPENHNKSLKTDYIFKDYVDFMGEYKLSIPSHFIKRTIFKPNESIIYFSEDTLDGLQNIAFNIFREKFKNNLNDELLELKNTIKNNSLKYSVLDKNEIGNDENFKLHLLAFSEVEYDNSPPNFSEYHAFFEMNDCNLTFYLVAFFDKRISQEESLKVFNKILIGISCLNDKNIFEQEQ